MTIRLSFVLSNLLLNSWLSSPLQPALFCCRLCINRDSACSQDAGQGGSAQLLQCELTPYCMHLASSMVTPSTQTACAFAAECHVVQEELLADATEGRMDESRRATLHSRWADAQEAKQIRELLNAIKNGFKRKRRLGAGLEGDEDEVGEWGGAGVVAHLSAEDQQTKLMPVLLARCHHICAQTAYALTLAGTSVAQPGRSAVSLLPCRTGWYGRRSASPPCALARPGRRRGRGW